MSIIDQLIEYLNPKPTLLRFKSISYSEFTDVKHIEHLTDTIVHYAKYERRFIVLIFLGDSGKALTDLIDELSVKYSVPRDPYISAPEINTFKRYSCLLSQRKELIIGFTKSEDGYFLVAERNFYHYYSLYGFCSTCGRLRCSPVWCICGRKELSTEWTSGNEQLDKFIRKSQKGTNTGNNKYLEWIPYDRIFRYEFMDYDIFAIPIESLSIDKGDVQQRVTIMYFDMDVHVEILSLNISNNTPDSFYQALCDEHPDIVTDDTWITIGFTYYPTWQKYAIIKHLYDWNVSKLGLCLSCTCSLHPSTEVFCFECKQPRPFDWTTGNKSLDKFIRESWERATHHVDSYLQWIPYYQLTNIKKSSSLEHNCSHTADWSASTGTGQTTRTVMLKKIVDGSHAQSFDFYQLTKDYPKLLHSDNFWIAGFTQETSTGDYFLVFYTTHAAIVAFVQAVRKTRGEDRFGWVDFNTLHDIHEIGCGGYGVALRARWSKPFKPRSDSTPIYVVLKSLNNFDTMKDTFFYEVKHFAKSLALAFLPLYGITQQPETGTYMMVMQHADSGDLLSYLNRNINSLTWSMKVEFLINIVENLKSIHREGLMHCDLHAGNILFHNHVVEPDKNTPLPAFATNKLTSFVVDLGLAQRVDSSNSQDPSAICGVLPYIAPEVFRKRKFTQKSDIYAIGILMSVMATGEPPFIDEPFDFVLVKKICDGSRPMMPSSAPELYKELTASCYDADPDRRPTAAQLYSSLYKLLERINSDGSGEKVYKPNRLDHTSRAERDSKYTSKMLPYGDFSEPRNSCDMTLDTDEFEPYVSRQLDLLIDSELDNFDL